MALKMELLDLNPHISRVYINYELLALLTMFLQKLPIPFWEDVL